MTVIVDDTTKEPYYTNRTQVSGATCLTWDYEPPQVTGRVTATRYKDGVKLRNWRYRIGRGLNATTPFEGVHTSYESYPASQYIFGRTVHNGSVASYRKAAAHWHHGISATPALPPTSDLTLAANIAATKFSKRCEDVLSAFQGGVFLAELRETLHMIRHPGQRARRSLREYLDYLRSKKSKVKRMPPKNRLEWLSDAWLEWSYGIKPTVNDLDDASKVLDKRANQLLQELIPVMGVGSAKSVSFFNTSLVVGVTNMYCETRTSNSTIQVYAGAMRSKASGTPLLTKASLGLTPQNFVPSLWEAVPWSFLIDYFSNVGDVLQAWSTQHAGLAWGRQTSVREAIRESARVYPTPSSLLVDLFDHNVESGKTIARNKTVGRSYLTYIPVPDIMFELPGFGTKWINIAALITARQELRF